MILNAKERLYESDPFDLIRFAKAYNSLGQAVTEQLDFLFEHPLADVNPNAIELLREELGGMNGEIDTVLDEYLERRAR